LFIPLPKAVSRGDQILNAQYFEKLGYAKVLMQEDLNADTLLTGIRDAMAQSCAMAAAMAASPVGDGTAAVLKQIYLAAEGRHAGV
jgi:UDP-N-acetylglucosamine--N-acetylmuramyl-(pentapeptide) pyrophosphoryl-undecaprenol N-acetylglucosamine transferase